MLIACQYEESTLYDAITSARTACRNNAKDKPVILTYQMPYYSLHILITKNQYGVIGENVTVVKVATKDLPDLGNNNKPWGVDTDGK